MKVKVPKRHILRPNWYNDMVQRVLQWERQERWTGRKRQRPMAKKCRYDIFLWTYLEGVYIQLLPLGKAQKAHFSTSMWCNESWEASPPSMCLDNIIAHETYLSFTPLPLKHAPTCFTKRCGTSRTQDFEYTCWSGLQIMLNVQH
jgi:hypothetical protein